MNKQKTKVMTFRVPYDIYDKYEIRCIEEHITMSKILKDAINRFMAGE